MQPVPQVNPNLVAVGGEITMRTLLRAYQAGCFPWTENPVSWWSPDPRAIIDLAKYRIPSSLRKFLRKNPFQFTIDRCFDRVMAECAAPTKKRPQTWITKAFLKAYGDLHRAGYAHSVECWQEDKLAGGIYGVSMGGLFVGESMFHRVPNASKAALSHLLEHLQARNYRLFDIQMPSAVTMQFGATLITRQEYLSRLQAALAIQTHFLPEAQV